MGPSQAWSNPVEQPPPPRSWFPVIIAALCGLGLGVVLGLAVASIGGKSLAEVTAERDQALAVNAQLEGEAEQGEQKRLRSLTALNHAQEALEGAKTFGEELAKTNGQIATLKVEHEKSETKMAKEAFHDALRIAQLEDQLKNQDAVPDSAPASPDWRLVRKWTIYGDKPTELFPISGRPWRVRWESSIWTSFSVYRSPKNLITSGSGEKSDWSMIYDGPGNYYLDLSRVGDGPVTFFVEEPSSIERTNNAEAPRPKPAGPLPGAKPRGGDRRPSLW